MKKYVYDGKTYLSEKVLRNAIFEKERKAFSKTPSENEAEFWAKHGVTYSVEEPALDSLKSQKKARIKTAFNAWNTASKLRSSLGFKIDADNNARNSIDDLLGTLGDGETVNFRDADNEYHELNADKLKVLKSEIAQNNIYAHEQKWELEQKVAEATDKETLRVIRVEFEGKDFTQEG